MRNTPLILGTISFIVLTFLLNWLGKFHFLYIEQLQLFQFTWDYFRDMVASPGGFSLWVGEFLTQFFILPYGGPVILALFLTLIVLMCRAIIRRLSPSRELYLLYFLPVLALLIIQFDFNYLFGGTVAYFLAIMGFSLFVRLEDERFRWGAMLLLIPLLFVLGGASACLFTLLLVLWELLSRPFRGWILPVAAVAEFGLLSILSVSLTWANDFRFVWSPDLYYHPLVDSPLILTLSWALLLLSILLARFCPEAKALPRWRVIVETLVQFACLVGFFWWGFSRFGQSNSLFMKELDYYSRTGQWDNIIKRCQRPLNNYLYINYLNIALAERGLLAESMFAFDQHGLGGFLLSWDKMYATTTLLSESYFTIGQIAVSQECAFEGNIIASGRGSVRHMQRLAQTNLICGEYVVAEKYLDALSNTFFYADWAERHRRFLYNDEAVEADPLLGSKRALWRAQSGLANIRGLEGDLKDRLTRKPDDNLAIQYLGAYYLLSKNLQGFKELIESYYGTPALRTLPKSFQEAVILLAEKDMDYWHRFNLSSQVIQRFAGYRQVVLGNRNNPQLPAILSRSFGDTYWFYFIYKK